MKKLSIPQLGYYAYAFKTVGEELGFEIVVYPTNKETMGLGAKYSPEGVCVPFKMIMGNYAQALQKGATDCFFIGGYGACRQFCYSHLYQLLFKKEWPDASFHILYRENFKKVLETLAGEKLTYGQILKAALKTIYKVWLVERIEDWSWWYRPREKHKGETTRVIQECFKLMEKGKGNFFTYRRKFKNIKISDIKPIKIGVVGEIYLLIEPGVNCELDRLLGESNAYIHKYIRFLMEVLRMLHLDRFTLRSDHTTHKLAEPYLKVSVGGHGRSSVGDMVRYAKKGYDGVVHLLPFACLPEISARPLLKKISQEYDLPLLTLSFDEMTNISQIENRVEAFCEMIKMRKAKQGFLKKTNSMSIKQVF